MRDDETDQMQEQTNVVWLAWVFRSKECAQVVHGNISIIFDEQEPINNDGTHCKVQVNTKDKPIKDAQERRQMTPHKSETVTKNDPAAVRQTELSSTDRFERHRDK
jgi:DNA-binding transcriptional regulator of glucitol operon